MYNTRFTNRAINRKHLIKSNYKLVFDDEGKVLCGISGKSICDLNGEVIANFTTYEKGNNTKQSRYDSKLGVFRLVGNNLYLNDIRVGQTKGGPSRSSVALLVITCILLTLVFGFVAIIDTPNDDAPVISLEDKDGVITTDRRIAVFDNSIRPGSVGFCRFDVNNKNGRNLLYSFEVKELYNGKQIGNFPMRYRIKMNNIYILNEKKWVTSDKLSFTELIIADRSTQEFTLEWYWPFESGNDNLDTYFGNTHGQYSIHVKITAQFAEGDI